MAFCSVKQKVLDIDTVVIIFPGVDIESPLSRIFNILIKVNVASMLDFV